MRSGKGWWPWLVVAAAVAGVVVLAVVTFAPLSGRDGLPVSADRAQLTGGFLVAVAVPLILTVRWAWQRSRQVRTAVAPTGDALARAKDVLADLVAEQWQEEVRLRSLDHPDPIPVRWRTPAPQTPALMDHPALIDPAAGPAGSPAGGVWWTASSDDIAALADRFRRTRRRRLVILGGPGAGKTTLALQLLLHLLATRDQHPGEPVPVMLPVADWDTQRHPRLHQWVADRLTRDYPALRSPELGAGIAQALAGRGHLLPVLDGLDELPPPAQTSVITALNRSLGGEDQLILTSRTTEFTAAITAAGDVITSAAVLEPLPLTPAAAADYLTHCLPPSPATAWQHTLTALRATPPPHQAPPGSTRAPAAALAAVAATPLGLWLLRTVYTTPGTDPTPLTDPARFPTPTALQTHLFDQLIPALITTRPPSDNPAEPFRPRRHHDPAQVRHWLGYLAHHLTNGGHPTRDLAWWRLAATTHAITRTTQLTITLLTTLAVGLTTGLTARSWAQDSPGYADLHIRRRSAALARNLARNLAGLAFVIAAGLAFGIAFALMDVLAFGLTGVLTGVLTTGLTTGLVLGLPLALALGVMAWAATPAQTHHALTPMSSWRTDRRLNLIRFSTITLAVGLTFALTDGPTFEIITYGLVFGLALGLAGLAFGKHRAWWAYLLATWKLAWAGHLPRRLMPCLDDCHRLGLLRAVGPIYQFRHAELHDHLATTYQPPT